VTESILGRILAASGCGFLVAVSLPPWGWWPLAIVGIAGFELVLAPVRRQRSRFAIGGVFAAVWMAMGMGWMWFLTPPGYLIAVAIFSGFHAVAALAGSSDQPTGLTDILSRAGAHTAAEALRFIFPFGGVPLASLAISQSSSPLVDLGRFGGPVLVTWVTLLMGSLIAQLILRRDRFRDTVLGLGAVGLAIVIANVTVFTSATGETIRIAAVQGGGPQGTLAVETNPRDVIERHLVATATLEPDPDLDAVVWPENVIATGDVLFEDSWARQAITEQARRLGVPFVVGITERPSPTRFTNAQVVLSPDGEITGRYDKVRRVPFGEYIPLRGLLEAVGAPVDRVPTDAIAGTEPALLDVDGIPVGVVISWEVFFGGRARDGVGHGGQVVFNPTNGSSYTGTVLQTQQIASSRLRAVETGRWVLQVAPTGFSAVISPEGQVFDRTGISETAIIVEDLPLRTGRTLYGAIGDIPVIAGLGLVTLAAVIRSRVRRSPG
jgi:apolipoprotein N-acyltransferase